MTKPRLAIALLVPGVTLASSANAAAGPVALVTLAKAKICQTLFAKRLQNRPYLPRIGVRPLHVSHFTREGWPPIEPTSESLLSEVEVSP
jgi:hypothetical protein